MFSLTWHDASVPKLQDVRNIVVSLSWLFFCPVRKTLFILLCLLAKGLYAKNALLCGMRKGLPISNCSAVGKRSRFASHRCISFGSSLPDWTVASHQSRLVLCDLTGVWNVGDESSAVESVWKQTSAGVVLGGVDSLMSTMQQCRHVHSIYLLFFGSMITDYCLCMFDVFQLFAVGDCLIGVLLMDDAEKQHWRSHTST